MHTMGWPLDNETGGGSFMYHFEDELVAVGFVVHLNYANPYLRSVPRVSALQDASRRSGAFLEGGKRIAYGARAITEGGLQSVPQAVFPGRRADRLRGGVRQLPRIKGSHNAMLSGMLAAEAAMEALGAGRCGDALEGYEAAGAYRHDWARPQTGAQRQAAVEPLRHRGGHRAGPGSTCGSTKLFGVQPFGHAAPMASRTTRRSGRPGISGPIAYPKPDGEFSFDKLSSVFLSGTNHEEDQPVHLVLKDFSIPIGVNLPIWAEPAQRYCPAGVYEVVYDESGANPRFQINAQNCVHCKTCDIKDPSQNIDWTVPEGGGGPNYPNM